MKQPARAAGFGAAQAGDQTGSSRIHLAHVLSGGAIWNVSIATTAGHGSPTDVLLEFERKGGDGSARYSTPLSGRLREALYAGGSVSRTDLVSELELAIMSEAARSKEAAASESG